MSLAVLGIGSNLDPEKNSLLALAAILREFDVERMSSIFETPSVGAGTGARSYYNACIVVRSERDHSELKASVRAIESELGRTREQNNPYRTIDIDILALGPSPTLLVWFANPARSAFDAALAEVLPPQALADGPPGQVEATCVWQRCVPAVPR